MAPPAPKSANKARPKSRELMDAADDLPEPPVAFPLFDDADIANEKWNVGAVVSYLL